jgi:hypothetical protein
VKNEERRNYDRSEAHELANGTGIEPEQHSLELQFRQMFNAGFHTKTFFPSSPA